MKILIPAGYYQGGTNYFIGKAFRNLGHDIQFCYRSIEKNHSKLTYKLKIRQFKKFDSYIKKTLEKKFNNLVIKTALEFKPDIFFSLNCKVFPETMIHLKNLNIITVSWVADNPFDSTRFTFFPINLKYYDYLFLGDMIWEQNIRNLAPKSKIFQLVGAYAPDLFKPVTISKTDLKRYGCNLAFAGSTYGEKAEGIYRVGILAQIADFDLKIWGGDSWNKHFKYYPRLIKSYQGSRLEFHELNKLYQITKININLPNPQLYTTFQQRVFEIAAAKGFQIVDYRKDIYKYFTKKDIVTFKSIDELKEKIKYFLNKPDKRIQYIENAYQKVKNNHTYEIRMQEMLKKIRS